jgi:hypothetical protein
MSSLTDPRLRRKARRHYAHLRVRDPGLPALLPGEGAITPIGGQFYAALPTVDGETAQTGGGR